MSDEYETMGAGELRERLNDWIRIGQERSNEILRLRAALQLIAIPPSDEIRDDDPLAGCAGCAHVASSALDGHDYRPNAAAIDDPGRPLAGHLLVERDALRRHLQEIAVALGVEWHDAKSTVADGVRAVVTDRDRLRAGLNTIIDGLVGLDSDDAYVALTMEHLNVLRAALKKEPT